MSPLWRDEVLIGLAPGRLELVRRGRGWKPAVEHAALVDVVPARGGDSDWAPGMAALALALSDPCWQRAQCRIVLSNHHVRFALIDAPAELDGDEERSAFVDLRYRAIYGDRAEAWQTTFAPFGAGTRTIAGAVDSALLDALRECAGAARLSLTSAQPYLVAAFNRVCDQVRGENAWFVTVEDGRIGMAAFTQDRLAGIRSEPLRGDIGESIASLLVQDALARELVDVDCRAFICAPGWQGPLVAPGPGWTLQRVGEPDSVPKQAGQAAPGPAMQVDPARYPLTFMAAVA